MKNSKIVSFVFLGALAGAAVSLMDKQVRGNVNKKLNELFEDASFYAKNPSILKSDIMNKKKKYEAVYQQIKDDTQFIKEQIEELKSLTPQVLQVVEETKNSFNRSTSTYKSMIE